MENYFFLKNTSQGAVSDNVLYYNSLPITRYTARFYANNYFELLPIVSTAFNIFCVLVFFCIAVRVDTNLPERFSSREIWREYMGHYTVRSSLILGLYLSFADSFKSVVFLFVLFTEEITYSHLRLLL